MKSNGALMAYRSCNQWRHGGEKHLARASDKAMARSGNGQCLRRIVA